MLVLIRQQSFSHNSHSLHPVPLVGVEPRHLLLLQQCIAHSRESHLADLRLPKESCYCVMMCLYLCGYISEVIAMNQYISFCNYGDVEMMMKSNDINDACIQAGNSGSTHSQLLRHSLTAASHSPLFGAARCEQGCEPCGDSVMC